MNPLKSKEHLSSIKIATYPKESCCYRIPQVVEFYLIYHQDIDYQSESNFPGRFVILEGILFDHPSHDEVLKDVVV